MPRFTRTIDAYSCNTCAKEFDYRPVYVLWNPENELAPKGMLTGGRRMVWPVANRGYPVADATFCSPECGQAFIDGFHTNGLGAPHDTNA